MRVTIVIPVYNEIDTLPILLSQIDGQENPGIKFLIVDNGSTMTCVTQTLQDFARSARNWSTLRLEENQGFGGAVASGLKHAVKSGDWVGWMPGNLRVDLADVFSEFHRLSFDQKSIYKFHRVGRSFVSRLKTLGFGIIQSAFAKTNLMDSGGTPTIIPNHLAQNLLQVELPSDYRLETFTLLYFRLKRIEVKRPKIQYVQRPFGKSHWQRGLRSELSLLLDTLESLKVWRNQIN